MKVGIIGAGMMGSQIARRLAQKGHKVIAFNRDKSKAERLRTTNLSVVDQPKDIGHHCEIALICVRDYEAVSDVSFNDGGLVESQNKDLVVLQCSTISPDESNKAADLYLRKGIRMVSVPIVGGVTAAGRGELVLIAAGDKTVYDQSESILKDISKQIFYIGCDHRAASVLKLAVNINIALISLALTEGMILVRGNKIDPNIFLEIFNSTYFKTGISENKGSKIAKDEYSPSFYLTNMVKDLNLALRTVHNSSLTLPTTAAAQAIYRASEIFGEPNMDYTSVASFLLKLNGYSTFKVDRK